MIALPSPHAAADTPVLVLLLPMLVSLASREGGADARTRTLIPVNSAVLIGGDGSPAPCPTSSAPPATTACRLEGAKEMPRAARAPRARAIMAVTAATKLATYRFGALCF